MLGNDVPKSNNKMTYPTFQNFNATGLDDIFLYVQTAVPIFVPLILFAIFMITSVSIYFGTKRQTGYGDIIAGFAVGSYLTDLIAILMTLKDGLINAPTLAIVIVISFILTLALFFSRGER